MKGREDSEAAYGCLPEIWEIPVGIGLIWVLAAFLALPAGQGIVFALRGDGFAWPGPELGQSLLGLLAGHLGRGLSPELRATAPPEVLVYAVAALVEVALASAAVFGLSSWWRTSVRWLSSAWPTA